jgi:hypothetical protein
MQQPVWRPCPNGPLGLGTSNSNFLYLTRSRQLRCCARQVPQQPPPQVPRRYRPRYALPLQHLNGLSVLFLVGDSLLRTDGRSGKEKSTERADVDFEVMELAG